MLDCADRFAALNTFPYVLIEVFLTVFLSTFPAFLCVLITIILLISADYTLHGVVGSNCALARGACNMFFVTATDLSTRLTRPAMFLADRPPTSAAAESMFLTDWLQPNLTHPLA